MNYGAFGLVEVVGSSNAILVIDQTCHCFSDR